MLVAHGADTAARNFAGRTPAERAAANGHAAVAAWLGRLAAGDERPPDAAEMAAGLRLGSAAGAAGAAGALSTQASIDLDCKPSRPSSSSSSFGSTLQAEGGSHAVALLTPAEQRRAEALLRRPWDGLGSPGAPPKPGLRWYRASAVALVITW